MRKTTTPVTTLANKSITVGMRPARSSVGGHVHVGHAILPIRVE